MEVKGKVAKEPKESKENQKKSKTSEKERKEAELSASRCSLPTLTATAATGSKERFKGFDQTGHKGGLAMLRMCSIVSWGHPSVLTCLVLTMSKHTKRFQVQGREGRH